MLDLTGPYRDILGCAGPYWVVLLLLLPMLFWFPPWARGPEAEAGLWLR